MLQVSQFKITLSYKIWVKHVDWNNMYNQEKYLNYLVSILQLLNIHMSKWQNML